MPSVEQGQMVLDCELRLSNDKCVRLSDYRGKNLVLYFYPRASTPGCTQEGLDFSSAKADFDHQNTVILGASRDGLKAQERFREKQGFPFDLVCDTQEALCNLFDVIKMKNMYGKQVRGIERSTFLIDDKGRLTQEWRKVRVKDHVSQVLEAATQLSNQV